MATAFLLVAAVALVAFLLVRFFPNASQYWFNRIMTAKTVLVGALWLIIAFVFLWSGLWYLVAAGALIYLAAFLWLGFRHPNIVQEARSWIA